jgi:hypothetical protein
MQFVILTRNEPGTDFRRAFAKALREEGHDCYVALVRKTLVIDGPREDDPVLRLSPIKFLSFLRNLLKEDDTVVVDSLILGDPLICVAVRMFLWQSIWAYDMHDNFLYDRQGHKRLTAWVRLKLHLSISTFSFHAARTLEELFPKSLRLGNASHLARRNRKVDNLGQILILANVDERFDFDLVGEILRENKVELHLFGSLAEGSTHKTQLLVRTAFEALRKEFRNFAYFGSYSNESIEGILDRYQIMLAPYKVNDLSTRYIDPLRFYHALNRGLEVISTPIPAVHDASDFIHVINSAEDFRTVLRRLSEDVANWRNDERRYVPVTWNTRARYFVSIAEHQIASRRSL